MQAFDSKRFPEVDENRLQQIPEERIAGLKALVQALQKAQDQGTASLVFVCTHNSRRSQLAQVWSAVWAGHFGLQVKSYSAGTEATQLPQQVITTLADEGIRLSPISEGKNPHYLPELLADTPENHLFSKALGDSTLPEKDFIAVMVCDSADANCPFVPGASARISLPFEDPKQADGTEQQAAAYKKASRRIMGELAWVYRQIG